MLTSSLAIIGLIKKAAQYTPASNAFQSKLYFNLEWYDHTQNRFYCEDMAAFGELAEAFKDIVRVGMMLTIHGHLLGYTAPQIICDHISVKNTSWPLPPVQATELKAANTSPSATNCVSCSGNLKDPGMGPTYKYCPTCEG